MSSDVWSVTSFNALQRDGVAARRWNLLHPEEKPRLSYVEECLRDRQGPGIASTDYIRTFAEQIRPYRRTPLRRAGTDGYGRSDFRRKLRAFFEVDRHFVALAALHALAEEGTLPASTVKRRLRIRDRSEQAQPDRCVWE